MLQPPYSISRVEVKVPAHRILLSAKRVIAELEDDLYNDPIPDRQSMHVHREACKVLTKLLIMYPEEASVCRWSHA